MGVRGPGAFESECIVLLCEAGRRHGSAQARHAGDASRASQGEAVGSARRGARPPRRLRRRRGRLRHGARDGTGLRRRPRPSRESLRVSSRRRPRQCPPPPPRRPTLASRLLPSPSAAATAKRSRAAHAHARTTTLPSASVRSSAQWACRATWKSLAKSVAAGSFTALSVPRQSR